ncbi:unnamed protein product [Hermetia illucens]|uniref:Uncharacterized protein n=1 Tax=Hermetia illucens TaxID=343691 RepID=A0A7R8UL71_HERIL|nr:unnamed protein product [Hermetia illucens]
MNIWFTAILFASFSLALSLPTTDLKEDIDNPENAIQAEDAMELTPDADSPIEPGLRSFRRRGKERKKNKPGAAEVIVDQVNDPQHSQGVDYAPVAAPYARPYRADDDSPEDYYEEESYEDYSYEDYYGPPLPQEQPVMLVEEPIAAPHSERYGTPFIVLTPFLT